MHISTACICAPSALCGVTKEDYTDSNSKLDAAVHLDSSPGSVSYSGMNRPSLVNLGSMKKHKHVAFVHHDDAKEALTAGVFNRLLALFSPLGLVMRRLDELRVILCLYELIMLPLRLAFGTGYGILAPPRSVSLPYD